VNGFGGEILKANRKMALIALSIFVLIAAVAAYVYETAQHQTTQTIKEIANIQIGNAALGNIEEGQTIAYTKVGTPILGQILNVTTTKDNVYLHFASDIAVLTTYYTTFQIVVKFAAVGSGSTHSVGDVACTMTIASPNPSEVTLDKLGTWSFDFEITTTAKSVTADQSSTATVTVTAEST
jgi:hypothetical protein